MAKNRGFYRKFIYTLIPFDVMEDTKAAECASK